MGDQDNKNMTSAVLGIMAVLFIMIISYTLYYNNIAFKSGFGSIFMPFIGRSFLVISIAYALGGFAVSALMPNMKIRKHMTENTRLLVIVCSIITFFLVCIGHRGFILYDLVLYPIILVAHIPLCYFAIVAFKSRKSFNNEDVLGISTKDKEYSFRLPTEDGKELVIPNPEQNIWFDAGPGSGKSDQQKKLIRQAIQQERSCVIYDYEGDPTKTNSPILTRHALACILEEKKRNKNLKVRFAFINFIDMERTVRVNVLSNKYNYFNEDIASLFIRNLATGIMKNLETAWKVKTDFWANNAINYVYSIAYKLYNDRKEHKFNTLAHTIAIALQDNNLVFKWLESDEEICMNMASMISAWKEGANQQTAGVVSSAQTPLVLLNNPLVFWVFSPSEEEEFNLDVTNKDNPVCLCIGNAPSLKKTVSPGISCIANVLMELMNQSNKNHSIFLWDELPTIILNDLDSFMGTARKHNVCSILSVQDHAQLVRDYGKESAEIIRSACGTQFYGMTGNFEIAKNVEAMFGEVDITKYSISENDNGGGSTTESQQKEKVVKSRDVMGQIVGHFFGKVANGEPPFFGTRFTQYTDIVYTGELPKFTNIEYNTGDAELDKEIFRKLVKKNYERIIQDAKNLLEQYKEAPKENKPLSYGG